MSTHSHRCDKNPACSLIWWFQCIHFCCSYLWILRKCLFKIPMLCLIMPFQIGNLHHSYSLLSYWGHGSCVGWREIECKCFSPFFFEFSLSTFLLAVNLKHAIFVKSRLLQPTKSQQWAAPETWKWKLKIALAAVNDPVTHCLCIVGMETRKG